MIRQLVSESLAALSPIQEGPLPDTYQAGIQMLPQMTAHYLRKRSALSSGLFPPHQVLALPPPPPSRGLQSSWDHTFLPLQDYSGRNTAPRGLWKTYGEAKKDLFSRGIHKFFRMLN